jgi:hypothetical protein
MPKYIYPLKVSVNKRYLVDQNNVPFLLQGDAAWSIIVGLTREEVEQYLHNRRQKGFNTIMVNLIEHKFCKNPPKNAYGEEPFTKPGDFSTPNEKYFAHVDWVIEKAADYNIQVLLAPIYLGYEGTDEGWFKELMASNLETRLEYGRYLGNRYRNFDNLTWLMGGDRNPGPALERIDMIALGIKEFDKRHLFTAHCHPETSAIDQYLSSGWLDFNTTYTYAIVHRKLLYDYNRTPIMPFILVESTYEGEHNASEVQIRRQAYWSVLCGGFGHIFGNWPIWAFGWKDPLGNTYHRPDVDWKAALDSPGATSMMHWGNLFRSRKWCDLVPDQRHQVVTDGLGEFCGLDYLAAACTTDNSTVIAYMPSRRTITLNMSKINGITAKAWWFDPRTGNATFIGEFKTKGLRKFKPPKEGDWIIILDDASKDLPPPGIEMMTTEDWGSPEDHY